MATRVSYQWQYSATKTGTFSDIKYGGNKNSYEISEEDEDYYLRCKVTTSSSKGKVPDAYRWFKCAGLGSGAGLVAKELGSSPSLSLSGLQGSYINCEVTLTVNGKSKTFVPKAICNGKVSDGIYVRPRIG